MGGTIQQKTKNDVASYANTFEEVQAVVLGCTELPLAITQKDIKIPLFDSLHILAKATVDYVFAPPQPS